MSNDSKGNLEKIMLAGIGALAVTGEKSKELLDELVKKGELTVEQGKTLNEELKHTIKNKVVKPVEDAAISEMINNLDKFSADQIAALKAKLQEMEGKSKKEDETTEG